MSNKVAVILPVYKNDKVEYLSKAVDSVIIQTYRDFHIFIGVDGPVDGSLERLLSQFEGQNYISIIRFEENRGLPCVLNDLLYQCFNEGYNFIARMDADDISMPDRFELQMAFFSEHPDVDIVGGAIEEIDEFGRANGKIITYPYFHKDCKMFLAKRNPHAHPSVMIRKRFFDKVGHLYRPDYRQGQDLMMWYDGMVAGTIHANLQVVVLKYRITEKFFSSRRKGFSLAKRRFGMRMEIKRGLNFGHKSTLYALAEFVMLVSPAWVKKIAYSVFR